MSDRPAHTEEDARTRLAERLYSAMEHLDPSQQTVPWDDLGDDEKGFYRASIMALESERDLWSRLICRAAV